jgi:hypothetical protein
MRLLIRSAYTALALVFSLASFNRRHFERIEGLKIEILSGWISKI